MASFELIHENGKTSSGFVGIAFGAGDDLFLGGSKSQTGLSARTAPPAQKTDIFWFVAIVFGIGGIFLFYLANAPLGPDGPRVDDPDTVRGFGLLGVVVCIVSLVIAVNNSRWNSKVWPSLYRQWKSTWMCMRCGSCFRI